MTVRYSLAAVLLLVCAACSLAPDYVPPSIPNLSTYKEMQGGWEEAKPADDIPRGPWWHIYHDIKLDELEEDVTKANQNLKVALAQYQEAHAAAEAASSDLFPTITGNAAATRNKLSGNTANRPGKSQFNDYSLGASASYEIDLWGKVRNEVAAEESLATASKSDLENVELSLHAELASDYFALRADDAMQKLLDKTVAVDQKALELTQNRFKGGVSPEVDVDQAETQLQNAKTQAADTRLARAKLEHAIAVLIGKAPAELTLEAGSLGHSHLPSVRPGLPSALLERRPDIAAAERRASAANAEIGVARAAYFPDFSLSGVLGFESSSAASWLTAPSRFWTLGPSMALTLFDAGRISSLTDEARAAFDEASATYRQTVLSAYQEVEDNLSSLHHLNDEGKSQHAATGAAERVLAQERNLYAGGAATYLDVAISENTALQAELADITVQLRLITAHIQLIKALGGGW